MNMNRKDYKQPCTIKAIPSLRASLLAGSTGQDVMETRTTVIESGSPSTERHKDSEGVVVGSKEDNPLWN